ncbi:MAG TPA: menaquinone biosynthesis protein [Dissulfurispiraceae bacterium]|nr:menaquinone biosynthesis protein [Dissulfurispiraceae bacterium]
MADQRLKIGRIPFANLFPIFQTLEKEFDCSLYEFIDGVPSRLNDMLREGTIDLSPSSSVEYLRNPSLYRFIEGISVSSMGPVGSIFLFSTKPIERLGGGIVCVTSQSATSVALLDVVLKRFYGIEYSSKVSENPFLANADAFLLIGDEALMYGSMQNKGAAELAGYMYRYDLGQVWYEKTGLPFVFALWIVRKEVYDITDARHDIFEKFVSDLMAAKQQALLNLEKIADQSSIKNFLQRDEIIAYWNMLDYELTEEHKKGLDLFKKYMFA